MFVDTQPNAHSRWEQWLARLSRRHPRTFTAALVLLAILVALGLLLDVTPPIVLYQGF